MITGFNTDVKYKAVTYHVQTEDKGLGTPLIISLIYQNGTILASKRSSYEDILKDFDEKTLQERLQRQHKLMCAAIQSGRIEDLKRMTIRNAAKAKKDKIARDVVPEKEEVPETLVEPPIKKVAKEKLIEEISPAAEPVRKPKSNKKSAPPIEKPETPVAPMPDADSTSEGETVWDISMTEGIEIVEDDEFFDEGFVLSPDAIRIIDDFAPAGIRPDEELKIKFLADYVFRAGEKKNVNLLVYRGDKEKEVENASVMIKVLGSSFRPIIFHAKTDQHGIATVFVKLPMFRSGRAAILVRASTEGEETELRKVIMQR